MQAVLLVYVRKFRIRAADNVHYQNLSFYHIHPSNYMLNEDSLLANAV